MEIALERRAAQILPRRTGGAVSVSFGGPFDYVALQEVLLG